MATLQQIRADILSLLTETDAQTHFQPSVLNGFINRAVEITALLTENSKDSIEIVVQNGVGAYTLPSDNLLIKSAYFGDKNTLNDLKPLQIYTEETLKYLNPFWLDETNDSKGQPRRLLWLDRMTVFLDPRPDATYSTNKKLVLFYIFQPTPMSQDSQSPNLGLAYHMILKFYALYLCYGQLRNVEMSKKHYDDWLSHYKLISQELEKGAEELFRWKWNFKEE